MKKQSRHLTLRRIRTELGGHDVSFYYRYKAVLEALDELTMKFDPPNHKHTLGRLWFVRYGQPSDDYSSVTFETSAKYDYQSVAALKSFGARGKKMPRGNYGWTVQLERLEMRIDYVPGMMYHINLGRTIERHTAERIAWRMNTGAATHEHLFDHRVDISPGQVYRHDGDIQVCVHSTSDGKVWSIVYRPATEQQRADFEQQEGEQTRRTG